MTAAMEVAPFAGAWVEISRRFATKTAAENVAPFAGAWVEMLSRGYRGLMLYVAPFAGAWVEILSQCVILSRKSVAPFAGAWVEIGEIISRRQYIKSRTLRGCVG